VSAAIRCIGSSSSWYVLTPRTYERLWTVQVLVL
jgi:hypothetical protein